MQITKYLEHMQNKFLVSLSSPVCALVLCRSYCHSMQYRGAVRMKVLPCQEFFIFLHFQLGPTLILLSDCLRSKLQLLFPHYRKKLSKFSHNPDWRNASNYVAKRYMKEVAREVYFEDVKLQMDSKLWGEEYSKHSPPKKVTAHSHTQTATWD